jgi:hypothetical protein
VTVKGVGVLALRFAEVGETVQAAAVGVPEQAKLTIPFTPAASRLYVAGCPAATVFDELPPLATERDREVPIPLKASDCGLPPALSATTSIPFRAPVAWGVKDTGMVQTAPGAKVAPQLFCRVKSLRVVVTPEMLRVEVPTLLTLTCV